MFVLQIEHEVFDFESWKKAFDSDPNGQTALGISQYEVFCLSDNPKYVIFNFWFEEIHQAENSMILFRDLWEADVRSPVKNPRVRIFDMIDWNFID